MRVDVAVVVVVVVTMVVVVVEVRETKTESSSMSHSQFVQWPSHTVKSEFSFVGHQAFFVSGSTAHVV